MDVWVKRALAATFLFCITSTTLTESTPDLAVQLTFSAYAPLFHLPAFCLCTFPEIHYTFTFKCAKMYETPIDNEFFINSYYQLFQILISTRWNKDVQVCVRKCTLYSTALNNNMKRFAARHQSVEDANDGNSGSPFRIHICENTCVTFIVMPWLFDNKVCKMRSIVIQHHRPIYSHVSWLP